MRRSTTTVRPGDNVIKKYRCSRRRTSKTLAPARSNNGSATDRAGPLPFRLLPKWIAGFIEIEPRLHFNLEFFRGTGDSLLLPFDGILEVTRFGVGCCQSVEKHR